MLSSTSFREKDYYFQEITASQIGDSILLNDENTHHNAVVLRRKVGDHIIIIDGKGHGYACTITSIAKRHCAVQIVSTHNEAPRPYTLHVGMGFTKNKARYEWFLEKSVEIGIDHIIQLNTFHAETHKVNEARLQNIASAAMIQSRTYFSPKITLEENLVDAIETFKTLYPDGQIFIAHCEEGEEKKSLIKEIIPHKDTLILIGPEGDFSKDEITTCIQAGAIAVALGPKRLRTETAAIYATTVFNAINYE